MFTACWFCDSFAAVIQIQTFCPKIIFKKSTDKEDYFILFYFLSNLPITLPEIWVAITILKDS